MVYSVLADELKAAGILLVQADDAFGGHAQVALLSNLSIKSPNPVDSGH
ncbi:MAG: hypothetical protein ACOYJV_02770 [Aminivibrio sp.]